ncbi:hypothetical protein K3495_g15209 [Podosphaera aphanis]|nr:hypothetical protein K3495_g15209 [Podosphaera aphanis]
MSIGAETITIRGPDGYEDLILRDVAYVTGYFTSIVSLAKLEPQLSFIYTSERELFTINSGQF